MSLTTCGRREQKRARTSQAIHRGALELTAQLGLDSWTMADLADRAAVSRRTLFNYYPGKLDAVLGVPPVLPDAALETFRAGGPSGLLLRDLVALALSSLDEADDSQRSVELRYRAMRQCPEFAALTTDHLEKHMAEVAAHIAVREGNGFDPMRARVAIGSVKGVIDAAIQTLVGDPHAGELADLIRTGLADLESLLEIGGAHAVPAATH